MEVFMNTYQYFNPYYRNTQILHGFFSKPIVLILAISFALQPVISLLSGTMPTAAPVLCAIAFFILYFKSKKPSPASSLTPAFTLLSVYSILLIVSSGFLILSGLFLFLIGSITMHLNIFAQLSLMILPSGISDLLCGIGLLLLTSSFKKSITSIYLYKKGALLTSISHFISTVISIVVIIFSSSFLTSISKSLKTLFEYYGTPEDSAMLISILETPKTPFTYITSILSIVSLIAIGVFALMYHNYIKKISETITYEPQGFIPNPQQSSPVMQQPTQPFDNNTPININGPVNFEPQPVFSIDEDAPEPIMQPLNNKPIQKPLCPNCSSPLEPNMKFCGKCGTKL